MTLAHQWQSGRKYLEQHETELQATANKRKGYLDNRYEIAQALLKMMALPGLAFANSMLCLSARTREHLKVRQREVGHLVLGAHRNTTSD